MRGWRVPKRGLWAALSLLVLAALAMSAITWRQFVDPAGVSRWENGPADAVIMFGGAGPRFEVAKAMVQAGVAPTIVISDPNDPAPGATDTVFGIWCHAPHAFEAVCFDPEPRTTRGESRAVADLARARGWHHVVAVTTTEQAARARLLLDRCWDGTVDVVVVDTTLNRVVRVAYEWAATARALVVRRSC